MIEHLKSFSVRLTRNIAVIVLVTMTIISMLAFVIAATGIYASYKGHYADTIANISRNVAQTLEKVEISAVNIADELSRHVTSPEDVITTLTNEIAVNDNLTGCGLGFVPDYFPEKGRWFEPYGSCADGVATVRDIGSASHDYHVADWFTSGLSSSEGVWTKPYLDQDGAGTLLSTYSLRIVDAEGRTAGIFGADLSLVWLGDLLQEIDARENESRLLPMLAGNKSQGIYSFILGSGGEYIVHPDRDRFRRGDTYFDFEYAGDPEKYRLLGESMCAGMTGVEIVPMRGRKYEVFYAPLSSSGWSMGIVVPLKSLLEPAFAFGFAILVLILFGLMIVALICHEAIRKFTRPLVSLAESATEVARGKFDVPLPEIKTEDEIRLLRDSLDNMQRSLSQYIDELTETTAQKASMESELDVAKEIQMSMVPMTWPAFPDRDDIDMFGELTPARAVGGDLYDFCLRDGRLYFCVGDVSGKGVPASLVMVVISSMFRTLLTSVDAPDRLMSIINTSMSARNENQMFVTLFVGELDLETGVLRYCNAGHNAPVILKNGVSRFLEADANVPVGIVSDWQYSLQTTKLPVGDVLFLYTDGLSEAAREDGSFFGDERILSSLAGHQDGSSQSLVHHMANAVRSFVGEAEQSDDLTMLAIKRCQSSSSKEKMASAGLPK